MHIYKTTHCFGILLERFIPVRFYIAHMYIEYRSPVNSPHKGQWRGALMFSFICVWINGWVNNRKAGEIETLSRPLWRHRNVNLAPIGYRAI